MIKSWEVVAMFGQLVKMMLYMHSVCVRACVRVCVCVCVCLYVRMHMCMYS